MNQGNVLSAIASAIRRITRRTTPARDAKAESIATAPAKHAGKRYRRGHYYIGYAWDMALGRPYRQRILGKLVPGKPSRDKGNRFEREIVNLLRAHGLDAYRVPLSGASRGYKGDVVIRGRDKEYSLEAKSRANGFNLIYQALGQNDFLAVKQDRQEALIVMKLGKLAMLLGQSEAKEPAASSKPASDVPLTHPHHSPLKDFSDNPY